MSGSGHSASDGGGFSVSVPPGGSVSLSLNASTTVPGDLPIASYKWSVNGSPIATGTTATYDAGIGTTVVIVVTTDQDGTTSSVGAEIDVAEIVCPNGVTPVIGTCDPPEDGFPQMFGSSSREEMPSPDVPAAIWVCYVTDGYEVETDGSLTYLGTDVDFCELEEPD